MRPSLVAAQTSKAARNPYEIARQTHPSSSFECAKKSRPDVVLRAQNPRLTAEFRTFEEFPDCRLTTQEFFSSISIVERRW